MNNGVLVLRAMESEKNMDEKYYTLVDFWWDSMPYGKTLILEFEYSGVNDCCRFCLPIPRRVIVSRRKTEQANRRKRECKK